MIKKKFFIIFLVLLIVSITPACAAQIGEFNNSNNNTSNNDSIISSINSDTEDTEAYYKDIQTHEANIDDSLNYIKNNWWKFWKWGSVKKKLDQIRNEADAISSIASNLKNSADKLKSDTQNLQNSQQQNDNNLNDNNITDGDAQKNANSMIKDINDKLNVTLATSNSQNLTEGDIVVYKSQNKYYRYLQYVKTENNNVILKGSRNKVITVSEKDFKNLNKLKLINKSPVNSSIIVNQAYKIQKSNIDQHIKSSKNSKDKSFRPLSITGAVIIGLGTALAITGAILITLSLFIPNPKLFSDGCIVLCVSALLLTIGIILLSVGLGGSDAEDKNLDNLYLMLDDLKTYDDSLNHPPIAENMNLTSNTTMINATLNASDIDEDVLNFTISNQPAHGTIKLETNGSFTYTANNDSNGTDSFTYFVNDGNLTSNNATVILNTNIPPVANNMTLTTRNDRNISTVFNATDPQGDKLSYLILSLPEHGTLNYTSDGNFIYKPTANYTGIDNFTYKVNDGFFDSNTAVVNIEINPNNPPVAYNMTLITKKGKSISKAFNITDTDGDELSITILTKPRHGTLNITADGSFTYIPVANYTGTDYFSYLGNDGFFNSNIANVRIIIRNH